MGGIGRKKDYRQMKRRNGTLIVLIKKDFH